MFGFPRREAIENASQEWKISRIPVFLFDFYL